MKSELSKTQNIEIEKGRADVGNPSSLTHWTSIIRPIYNLRFIGNIGIDKPLLEYMIKIQIQDNVGLQ